ncbi:hypothetical protein [Kallotenue papyrolyticum]|uniref:hypothetical protein n=1 Tax=Kallotenue papyrolyticum TaxID=1325125 RepID=UPI0004786796|nr:hypothetical protein [Kallotenue papyrolyticum]
MAHGCTYLIFYGWLADARGAPTPAAQAIALARPALAIVAGMTAQPRRRNFTPAVRELWLEAGISTLIYVPTAYARRDWNEVWSACREAQTWGAQGVLLDEVLPAVDRGWWAYYGRLYSALAGELLIALNTGVAHTAPEVMAACDLLMVEHQWRQFAAQAAWRAAFPSSRFMGVSSNELGAQLWLGRSIDRHSASAETRAAWRCGIGWHTSTARYTELPPWLSAYLTELRDTEGCSQQAAR